jgi:hypothetical protein
MSAQSLGQPLLISNRESDGQLEKRGGGDETAGCGTKGGGEVPNELICIAAPDLPERDCAAIDVLCARPQKSKSLE